MIEIILLIIGIVVGGIAGFYMGKSKTFQSADLSSQMGTIQNLTTQIAEMKGKFEVVEKSRDEIEKKRDQLNEEKEKRLKEENNFAPKTYQNDSNFPLSVSADCNFSPIQPFFSANPALPVWIYFGV